MTTVTTLKEIIKTWKQDSSLDSKLWDTFYKIHPRCAKFYLWLSRQWTYDIKPLVMRNVNRLRILIYTALSGKKRIDTRNEAICYNCGLPMIGRRFWINPDFTVHKLPFVVYMTHDDRFYILNVDETHREKKHFVESIDKFDHSFWSSALFDLNMLEFQSSVTATDLIFFEKYHWNACYHYDQNWRSWE